MDPRIGGPGLGQRDTSLRAEMQKAKGEGKNKNLCPCGCPDEALNDHGYCEHLIGFTNDGKNMERRFLNPEPIMTDAGRQLSWAPEERVGNTIPDPTDPRGKRRLPEYEPVLDDDIKVWITSTARVYRGPRVLKADKEDDVQDLIKQVKYQGMLIKELRKELGKEDADEPTVVPAAG